MPWPRPYLRRPLRRPRINRKPIFRSAPGGAAGARSAHKAGAGARRAPAPALVLRAGGPKAPRPAKHRRPPWERCGLRFPPGPSSSATPPNTASVSCPIPAHLFPQHPRPEPLQFSSFPSDSPRLPSILFPSHKPPYPKSLLETSRRLVSRAERFAALGEAPLSRFASRERPTPLPFYPSASQLLRGLGAEPPPAGVQGRGRPWPCGANATNYLPPPPIGIYTYSRLHPKREPFLRRK